MFSCDTKKSVSATTFQLATLKKYAIDMFSAIKEEKGEPMLQEYLDEYVNDPFQEKVHKFIRMDFSKLHIDVGYPRPYYNEKGDIIAIQLRAIDKKKILLGCGNNPTSIAYHKSVMKQVHDDTYRDYVGKDNKEWADLIIKQKDEERDCNFHHEHNDYITINPDISMNPTIVTFFGWYKMPKELLPSNYFEEIIDEGIDLENMRYYSHDYNRIIIK